MKSTAKHSKPDGIRDRILRTALHLFTERGYFNTSVHDIQRDAAVSIGSIYNHFGGKEGVAKALYIELVEYMNTFVAQAANLHNDTYGRCRAVVAGLFQLTEDDPEMIGFVLNARHREFLPDEPPICSSEPFVQMREFVLQGMQTGEVRRMDPMIAASVAYGAALRMISLRLDGIVSTPLPELTDSVWEASWQAIAADA